MIDVDTALREQPQDRPSRQLLIERNLNHVASRSKVSTARLCAAKSRYCRMPAGSSSGYTRSSIAARVLIRL